MANFPEPAVIVEDQHTVSDTALALSDFTGISAANVLASTRMWLTVNTESVRIWYGGSTPTVDEGALIFAGSDLVLYGHTQIANFAIIRNGSTDAEVVVVLEG